MDEEKTHDATPGRLQRARREGDLPRSAQVVAVGSLGASSLVLAALLPFTAQTAQTMVRRALVQPEAATTALPMLAAQVAIVCGVGACGAVAATLAQTRTILFRLPALRLDRLAPSEGLKRMCSADALIAGLRSLAAGVAVLATIAGTIRDVAFAGAAGVTLEGLIAAVLAALGSVLRIVLMLGAVFAAVEWISEQRRWRKRLRLSTAELKRDIKESDGDPIVRSRRKKMQRALLSGSVERTREAAFVLANPTHVAIALAYRPPEIAVPVVLVRAVDGAARAVRARAEALGIPIVEQPTLARFLLATTQIDQPIPSEAYGVVARVVAELIASGALA